MSRGAVSRAGLTHADWVDRQRRARMQRIDELPAEVRALVHEYGFRIVDNFLMCGVTKPRQIRHLVELVLDEYSPTRGSHSRQGIRTQIAPHTQEGKR